MLPVWSRLTVITSRQRWFLASLLGLAMTVTGPRVLASQSEDAIWELHDALWERLDAWQTAEAEQIARRMYAIAQRVRNTEPALMGNALQAFGSVRYQEGKYDAAQARFGQALEIFRKHSGEKSYDYAWCLSKLGVSYSQLGKYVEAEQIQRRAVQLLKAHEDAEEDVQWVTSEWADTLAELGRFKEAEQAYAGIVKFYERKVGPNSLDIVSVLYGQAGILYSQEKFAAAESIYQRISNIVSREGTVTDKAFALSMLADLQNVRGNASKALPLVRQAVQLLDKDATRETEAMAHCQTVLATIQIQLGNFAEAEQAAQQNLSIREELVGPMNPIIAEALDTLGSVYLEQGRYVEAETIHRKSVDTARQTMPEGSPRIVYLLQNLATVYGNQGRFAESDALLKEAHAIAAKTYGRDTVAAVDPLFIRAQVLSKQGRFEEANALFERCVPVFQAAYGKKNAQMALVMGKMAGAMAEQDEHAEALKYAQQAAELYAKFDPDSPTLCETLGIMATSHVALGDTERAWPVFGQALEIAENAYGADSFDYGYILFSKAQALVKSGKPREAEPLLDRAIAIYDRRGIMPVTRAEAYFERAKLAWQDNRRSEALSDLRVAINLAEEQRGQSSGAERERAGLFGQFTDVFETMVQWQAELGDVSEALRAIERSKARSLLDELLRPGVDIELGRSALDRQRLTEQENQLKSEVASLEKQLTAAAGDKQKAGQINAQLTLARTRLYDHYRDARSSSPVYRNLLTVGSGPLRLSQIQRKLTANDSLVLVYMLGKKNGYVVALGPEEAKLSRLMVDDATAAQLKSQAGPLTAERLRSILMTEDGSGLLQRLKTPGVDPKTIDDQLAALWQVLVPESFRKALTNDEVKQLIVIPDGPLALLPFETLVVEPGKNRKYLLDVGPPILYGPSATVLYNLLDRTAAQPAGDTPPVLTVGDPAYPGAESQLVAARGDALSAGSRFRSSGAVLARLPYSGTEARWVSSVYKDQGLSATRLLAEQATEANVRQMATGRRVLHLACHGLTDHAHGNFFGALALTPGTNSDGSGSNDGYLTFAEIYELDLKACELAILSACETNYGPEQRGEGVWGLSRGFLVAGARRTMASNWLVDDEAAASLVSYFCSSLAQAEKAKREVDYARSLHDAKRWVRQQDKWSSPYYWGTFVLVGPQ